MADATVERAVYQLIGDGSSYQKMMKDAEKSTKDFSKETDKFGKLDKTLTDLGEKAKKFSDSFGSTKASDTIKAMTTGWDALSDKIEAGKSAVKGWGETFTNTLTNIRSGLSTVANLMPKLFPTGGGGTAAGGVGSVALSFGMRAGVYAAIATAVAYASYQVYQYVTASKSLDKELKENKETVDKWTESYRAATEVMVNQAEYIPTAQGKIKYFFREWENVSEEMDKVRNKRKFFEKQITSEQLGYYGAGSVAGMFGVSMEDSIKGLKNWREELEKIPKGGAFSAEHEIEKGFLNISEYARDASLWIAEMWDSENVKRYRAEVANANTEYKVMDERLQKIVDTLTDKAGKTRGAFQQALGKEQTDVVTFGMSDSQKQLYPMQQQMQYFKAASEALEEAFEFDKADKVWEAYKALKNIYNVFKETANQKAIQQVQGSYKDFVKDLQTSIDTMGMSETQLRKWKLEQENIKRGGILTPRQMEELDEVIKKKEDAFANKKLMDEGKALNKQFLSEEMKFLDEWSHLEEMYSKGAITEGTYLKALDALEAKYDDVTDSAHELHDAIHGINAVAFGSSEHIARMMAQTESFRGGRDVRQERLRNATEAAYMAMGPGEDEATRRYRLMGPQIPEIARLGREGEDLREAERAKIGSEDFSGPLPLSYYAKQGVGMNDLIKMFGKKKAILLRRALKEQMKKGGSEFVGPTEPGGTLEHEDSIWESLFGGGEEPVTIAPEYAPRSSDKTNDLLKSILDTLKNNAPPVKIEEADFDEFD